MSGEILTHPRDRHTTARTLPRLTVPALVIGAMCAVLLWVIDEAGEGVTHLLWHWIPEAGGFDSKAWWWPIIVLGLAGAAVGTSIRYAPGHGGYDSATTELLAPPLPRKTLPGIAAALIVSLGAGVSLGPESPIISIAVGLSVWGLARIVPNATAGQTLLVAGWLGVAFIPGNIDDDTGPSLADLYVGIPIALGAAFASLLGARLMPPLWHLLRRFPNPMVFTTIGGLLLGVLGAVGGTITMFKGAAQTGELMVTAGEYTFWGLLFLAVIKVAALTVSAAAGFRGGRIFPAVFIGAAFGLAGHSLAPESSLALAIAAGAVGSILAIGRDCWLAIFMGVALAGDVAVLPAICVIVLPVWLIVTSGPEMLVHGAKVPANAGHQPPE